MATRTMSEIEQQLFRQIKHSIATVGIEYVVPINHHTAENHINIDDDKLIQQLDRKICTTTFNIPKSILYHNIENYFKDDNNLESFVMQLTSKKAGDKNKTFIRTDTTIGYGYNSSDGKQYTTNTIALITKPDLDSPTGFVVLSIYPEIKTNGHTTGKYIKDCYEKQPSDLYNTYLRCINEDANYENGNFDNTLHVVYNPRHVSNDGYIIYDEKISLNIMDDDCKCIFCVTLFDDKVKINDKRYDYKDAIDNIPQKMIDKHPDKVRNIKNFIYMKQYLSDGIPLPRSFDSRSKYEIKTESTNNKDKEYNFE